ncbi:hypothetical protein M2428_000928 [Arthrobacter sp. ES3-54]|nr:hypothetical protein [Arthrobacter sp. ES3-54]
MQRTAVTGHKHGSGQLSGFNDTRITCSFNYMISRSRLTGSPGARPCGFAVPGQHGLGIRACGATFAIPDNQKPQGFLFLGDFRVP